LINLIRNEHLKIYARSRTWILWAVLVIAIAAIAWITWSGQSHVTAWRPQLQTSIQGLVTILAHPKNLPSLTIHQLREQLLIDRYDLKHNLDPNRDDAWKFMTTAFNLDVLAMAFILVIAGDIVASEFASGTIKMLLTQTATRTKILVAKYGATLLFGLATTVVLFLFSLGIGVLVFGAAGHSAPTVYTNTAGQVSQMSVLSYLLMNYGFFLINMVVTATIAFMLSTIFRSSALSITVAILVFLVGNTLVKALSQYHWMKYVLFANTNLTQYVAGGPTIKGMTLGFSITMLVVYFVVMLGLSWWTFVKRDVSYG
jgi:ABC-2 type transport system permease protein